MIVSIRRVWWILREGHLFVVLFFTIAVLYCFEGKYCLQPEGTSSFIRHLDLRPRASCREASWICVQITFHRTPMRMVCGSFFLDFIQTKTFSRQTLSRSPAWVNLLIHFIKLSLWVKIEQSKKLLLYFACFDCFRDLKLWEIYKGKGTHSSHGRPQKYRLFLGLS